MKKRTIHCLFCLLLLPLGLHAQMPIPVKDASGKWGYQKEGTWIIDAQYETAFSFSDNLAGVKLKGKSGFIDQFGQQIIPFRYDDVWPFSEGLAAVKINGKWGFVDKKGTIVISYKYDEATAFSNGLAGVKTNGKWGFIDRSGNVTIPFKYDNAKAFADGLAAVRQSYKDGFIDRYDNWYGKKEEYHPLFSDYARQFVERRINSWQQKGKYEKTVDWQARVNENTRKAKISELTREAEKNYLMDEGRSVQLSQKINGYDADNEVFLVKDDRFGDLLVPVPIADAPVFENSFFNMKRSVRYFVENDKLALAELTFTTPSGKNFKYSNAASLDYFIANVDYKFAPIEIDSTAITRMQRGQQNIQYAKASTSKSDVDLNIPQSRNTNENTFAVIIANELYKHEDAVPYANADGKSFQQYCMQTLGLPEDRIHFCADATLNEMRMELNWLRDIGEAFGGEAKIIFYYAGHGVPNESTRSTYLLPIDGSGRDTDTGYDLSKLYRQLGDLPVKSVTVFLDACFSGAKREGGMMLAARGVVIKDSPVTMPTNGNVVVFSASQNDETALLYPQKGHGLFTYFLLKKLQETKGNTTLGELADYVSKHVNQEAVVTNRKSQTPSVICSPDISGVWKTIKLR